MTAFSEYRSLPKGDRAIGQATRVKPDLQAQFESFRDEERCQASVSRWKAAPTSERGYRDQPRDRAHRAYETGAASSDGEGREDPGAHQVGRECRYSRGAPGDGDKNRTGVDAPEGPPPAYSELFPPEQRERTEARPTTSLRTCPSPRPILVAATEGRGCPPGNAMVIPAGTVLRSAGSVPLQHCNIRGNTLHLEVAVAVTQPGTLPVVRLW